MTNSKRQATKSDWRRVLRQASGGLDAQTKTALDNTICQALADFVATHVPAELRVVVYDALPEEIDLSAMIDAHQSPERRFAVTRTPEEGFDLTVHPWGGPVELHPYGYHQPDRHAPVVADASIGAVLVPAMAFDGVGNRLGRGKGYYDRFLSRVQAAPGRTDDALVLVGVAGRSVAENLPIDDHDIPMTHLALASGVWAVPIAERTLAEVDRLRL